MTLSRGWIRNARGRQSWISPSSQSESVSHSRYGLIDKSLGYTRPPLLLAYDDVSPSVVGVSLAVRPSKGISTKCRRPERGCHKQQKGEVPRMSLKIPEACNGVHSGKKNGRVILSISHPLPLSVQQRHQKEGYEW